MAKGLRYLALGAVSAIAVFFLLAPRVVDTALNRIERDGPAPAQSRVPLGDTALRIADLHADTLLWGRGVLERADRGHVDLARLEEAGAIVQGFTVVTRFPPRYDPRGTELNGDVIRWLSLGQLWPPRTWNSPFERALYQAGLLGQAISESGGRLVWLKSRSDMQRLDKAGNGTPVGALLGLEGGHALDGELSNVDRLFEAGFRVFGPVHVFDNELGGSGQGTGRGGLTEFGRAVLARAGELGMILDLAHASPKLIDDVLAADHPALLVSHTGVRATCDNPRNLSDAQLRRLGKAGALIGIGFFRTAVCGLSEAAIADAIVHTASVAGSENVALGSDFDGAVATPFDISGVGALVGPLLDRGMSEEEVRGVMGENTVRFLARHLPQ